jgi:serine/threonine-protein kinase haspin
LYNDLNQESDLFQGQGDLQFDIYRWMQSELKEDWSLSKPKTNIFWIHYILQKLTEKVGKFDFRGLEAKVLKYQSVTELVQSEVLDSSGCLYSICEIK